MDTPEIQIIPSRLYKLPYNQKQSFLDLESYNEFQNIIGNSNESIDKLISDKFIGLSRLFIQSLNLSGVNLYNRIKDITNNLSNLSLIPYKDDYTVTVCNSKESMQINFYLDDYYYKKETEFLFRQKRNSLLSQISNQLKKYSKRLENINGKLNECKNMNMYRIYGELITSNLYKYNSNVNMDSIVIENYYDNQNKISIPLDKMYSLSKNAEQYFKKYNKLKNTLKIVSVQKKETEIELEYIQSILFSIENANDITQLNDIEEELNESNIFNSKLKNQKSKKKNAGNQSRPIELNIKGYTIFVGKNNKQNDLLTFKIASRNDLWFHTQNIQGSHIILKTENKVAPESIIIECAKLARQNSKAKDSKNVSVDYCPVKNVKKPSGAKPGMVIYNNYKTIIIN